MDIEKLIEQIATILAVDKKTININSSITNTRGWDSYTHLHLIIELSIIYDFDITATVISNLISIEAICKYIKQIKNIIPEEKA